MVYAMALHLETAADSKSNFVGGITYDFKKCFDLIPPQFLFEALQARGMSQRIIGPLRHLYANIHRVFKLRGACGNFWTSSNGLVQGCPLSMIGLNAIVGVILELSEQTCPGLVARSYADDISAIAVASSSQALIQSVSKFHRLIMTFEEIGFGEISVKKSHTFGNTCLASQIVPQYQHCTNFRIVGGSLLADGASSKQAELEKSRYQKWSDTVIRMRYAPFPWRDKAKRLLVLKEKLRRPAAAPANLLPGHDRPGFFLCETFRQSDLS